MFHLVISILSTYLTFYFAYLTYEICRDLMSTFCGVRFLSVTLGSPKYKLFRWRGVQFFGGLGINLGRTFYSEPFRTSFRTSIMPLASGFIIFTPLMLFVTWYSHKLVGNAPLWVVDLIWFLGAAMMIVFLLQIWPITRSRYMYDGEKIFLLLKPKAELVKIAPAIENKQVEQQSAPHCKEHTDYCSLEEIQRWLEIGGYLHAEKMLQKLNKTWKDHPRFNMSKLIAEFLVELYKANTQEAKRKLGEAEELAKKYPQLHAEGRLELLRVQLLLQEQQWVAAEEKLSTLRQDPTLSIDTFLLRVKLAVGSQNPSIIQDVQAFFQSNEHQLTPRSHLLFHQDMEQYFRSVGDLESSVQHAEHLVDILLQTRDDFQGEHNKEIFLEIYTPLIQTLSETYTSERVNTKCNAFFHSQTTSQQHPMQLYKPVKTPGLSRPMHILNWIIFLIAIPMLGFFTGYTQSHLAFSNCSEATRYFYKQKSKQRQQKGLALIRMGLEYDKKSASCWTSLSAYSITTRQHKMGIHAAKKALRYGGGYMAHVNLATLYDADGQKTKALEQLEKANAMRSWYATFAMKAKIQRELGRYQQSLETCDTLVKRWKKRPNGYLCRCMNYVKLKQYNKAIRAVNPHLRMSRRFFGLYACKAKAQVKQGQLKTAYMNLTKAIILRPNASSLYTRRGIILLKLKKWEQAKKQFLTSLQKNKNNAKSLYFLATVHQKENNMRKALEYTTQARSIFKKQKKKEWLLRCDALQKQLQ
ncbi:MAG: hypothetical protein CL920_36490 [Deltaproteobacteria bacterium]|nr:hypothetical protein [Deltaproteobacteria bacterium]MBU54229.1 hypothetical protein [Deltaproteobacteria bacterium]